ncbi:TetR family transcriptional regulator [Agromyces sp. CFH 90414]|uniref:TetR family transcriptional regulator n=1 Tax=Agromyces agglutinans TaxID=2662258 RepID=A0A6I2F9N7_9MICO|nr:TetR/AcrR family transcriptional regulator [Agromyces agglutinans]MRG59066.1 TetR family transcriptional regulator [Agromyces agglutinans]
MPTRDDWLDEGLRVLAEQGAPAVRTDRIAARLGLTKGSFHHHFAGAPDYRRSLLDRYESQMLAALDAVVAEASAASPGDTFAILRDRAASALEQPLEAAMRAWAFQDDDARAAQGRVDTARLEALTALWSRVVDDPADARTAALLPHLVVIGAGMALPPVDRDDLARLFDLLVRLVPHAGGAGGGD